MKKKAFTLAEVLLTLAIISVLAAITLPLISHIRPDKDKMLYHKVYNTLAANVHKIVKDRSLYDKHMQKGTNIYNVSRYPLYNTDAPTKSGYSTYSGTSKLGNIIKDSMHGEGTYKDFKTKNGMVWRVDDTVIDESSGKITTYTKVEVDIDGKDNGPNKYYGQDNYKGKPDTFVFYITPSAEVVPADLYGQYYMQQRKNYTRQKDSDEQAAVEALKDDGEIVDLTTNIGDIKEESTFNVTDISMKFESDEEGATPDTTECGEGEVLLSNGICGPAPKKDCSDSEYRAAHREECIVNYECPRGYTMLHNGKCVEEPHEFDDLHDDTGSSGKPVDPGNPPGNTSTGTTSGGAGWDQNQDTTEDRGMYDERCAAFCDHNHRGLEACIRCPQEH